MVDDLYKREEDRKWRQSVEQRIVSLTTSQKQTDDDLDKLTGQLEEIEELLEGDPIRRDDTGLKGDILRIDTKLNELRAIMAPDALGKGGFKSRLESVESALGIREKRSGLKWQFVTAIVVALIASATTLITNWDKIIRILPKDEPDELHQRISRAKRPKAKTKIYRVRVLPAPKAPEQPLPQKQDPIPTRELSTPDQE